MLVKQIALFVLGYACLQCSSAAAHSSSHASHRTTLRRTPIVRANLTSSSIAHLFSARHHVRSHATISAPISSFSTITTPNITASATSGACPSYTHTLEAKRCPQLACGPEPMAQLGGGGPLPERCFIESTTTMPCGCPTPMATTTVLGGCASECPPKGCQIAWITAAPVC